MKQIGIFVRTIVVLALTISAAGSAAAQVGGLLDSTAHDASLAAKEARAAEEARVATRAPHTKETTPHTGSVHVSSDTRWLDEPKVATHSGASAKAETKDASLSRDAKTSYASVSATGNENRWVDSSGNASHDISKPAHTEGHSSSTAADRSSRTASDPLARDKYGRPVPDPEAAGSAHTQLGTKEGRNGTYRQAREFNEAGKPVKDIDFTDHGRPRDHPSSPHEHLYREKDGKRMPATPLNPSLNNP